jgi:hypothetical protein
MKKVKEVEKLTSKTLGVLNNSFEIEMYIHVGFLAQCNDLLKITDRSGMIHEFDSKDTQCQMLYS